MPTRKPVIAAARRPPAVLSKPGAERAERAAAVSDARAVGVLRRDLDAMRDDLTEACDAWSLAAADDPAAQARIASIRKRWKLPDDSAG